MEIMDNENTLEKQTEKKQPANTTAQFQPPKHWLGVEELEASYWENPEIREKRGQEFYEKPVEWLEKMDQSIAKGGAEGGWARREFLTVMGASMAMAATACARRPVHKIIPYVVKPEEITPGVANYYASASTEFGGGYGILVKTREGRPIKLEGNPEHPLNEGRISARCQASLLNLYDPDRLKNPITRQKGEAYSTRALSWSEADQEIAKQLRSAAATGAKVRIVSRPNPSETSRKLTGEFLSFFKNAQVVEFEPCTHDDVTEGQELSYGTNAFPHYHFEKADVVVSLGADFLGTWGSPVDQANAWSKRRKIEGRNADLSKIYVFETMMSVTGANADERYPVRPGDELKVALALAHELILKRATSSYASDSAVRSVLAAYAPEAIAEEIGLKGGAEVFSKVAQDLLKARGKGIVAAGGTAARTQDAVALQVVVNLINSALENEGSTIDGNGLTREARGSFAELSKLAEELKQGSVGVLVLHQANLAYWFSNWSDVIKKVPLVVVVSDRDDETGQIADYVLPESHSLESWGDAVSRKGLLTLRQPAISPLHDTRSFEDILLNWMKVGGFKNSGLASQSPTYHDFLKATWKNSIQARARGASGAFEKFWENSLRLGYVETDSPRGSRRSFRSSALSVVPKSNEKLAEGLKLVLYSKVTLGDGKDANNAWLQELPDPVTTITWDNYINIGPALAKRLNVKKDDVMELTAEDGLRVQLPVNVQPGLHPEVIAVAIGYGRTAVGTVGNGAGVNMYPFAQVIGNRLVYSGRPVHVKKTGRFYRLAATQWHTATEDRPVINDVTLAEYRKNPAAQQHTNPHLRLETIPTIWPEHEYKGYRWGMAIDLNSCTGCNACMVACQAENNIPVVGRDQVRVSRQMHWIRLDRYYSGDPEQPQVIYQPMLCQHCENAPCETVCPVLATVHNDEGLNIQAYNRCVGTRYCSNNCPYKVRRFNFFDHWKAYTGTMNMVWNPDVTVRTRGIMEKCTFCTHRITAAKDLAKDENRKVRDGEVVTACQQTCPTNAIVFGDMNDPNSRVSKLKRESRMFHSLEVINTRPSVNYLTKVRNVDSHSSHDHHEGAHS